MSDFKNIITYVFDILKYVINNKQYYYNNQPYEFNIKIWGDSIGNMLRNEEYKTINVYISNDNIAREFIKILEITKILKNTMYNDTSFSYILNLNIDNVIYTIRINTVLTYFSNNDMNSYYIPKIHATCNNLSIDINGNLNTVIPANNTIYCDNNAGWLMKCINDAIYKKFTMIIVKPITELSNLVCINNVYDTLLSNSFVYIDESLTAYPFIKIRSYKDMKEHNITSSASMCVICHESYDENKDPTILLGCMHDFHIPCLQKWIDSKKNTSLEASCPFCRKNITFELNQTYGNPQIDNIISNINLAQFDNLSS